MTEQEERSIAINKLSKLIQETLDGCMFTLHVIDNNGHYFVSNAVTEAAVQGLRQVVKDYDSGIMPETTFGDTPKCH